MNQKAALVKLRPAENSLFSGPLKSLGFVSWCFYFLFNAQGNYYQKNMTLDIIELFVEGP